MNGRKPTSADVAAAILRDLRELPRTTAPAVRAVRRPYSRTLADESPDVVLAIARCLLTENSWSARVVAFELLDGHEGARGRLRASTVEEMAAGLSDWGSVDLFGVTIAGPAWREGRVSDRHVMRWARSKDRWRRRLSLVATVPLNSRARGGAGDP